MAINDKNEILSKVVAIVAETLKIDKKTIESKSTFEVLGADSLDRLEIVMKFEEVFSIDITDEQAAQITSIKEAADAIHAARSA